MIVADTDVLIDVLHGRRDACATVSRSITEGQLATTVVSLFELKAGAATEAERTQIEALLAPLRILSIDPGAARLGAAVERDLRRRGLKIGTGDALIAGLCLAEGASLLTRNQKHFGHVPGLVLAPLQT